jgi:hypothetical protein
MKSFVLIFLSACLGAFAAEDPYADTISDNYEAGAYLIYDCEEGHWACVKQVFHDDCQGKQENESTTAGVRSRCAAFGEQASKKGCFQRQLYMVSQNWGTRACVKKAWKEKEIKL